MNSKIIIPIILFIFLVSGCKTKTEQSAKPGEGTVTYNVSYPDSAKYGMKASLFPHEMNLFFKDDKATFVAAAGMGTVQIVNILDHSKNTYTSLLIDAIRQNYACKLSPEEIKENENNPKFEFEFIDETKIIAGLECKKVLIKNIATKTTSEAFYYPKIKFYYMNSPFKDFGYLFMEYSHTINNLTMKLVATNVDLKTPVDTTFFEVHGEFLWISQKNFFAYLNQL